MMKKVLIPFVGLAMVFAFLAACSNDSDSNNLQVSGPSVSTVAKLESSSFIAGEGSCGGSESALKKDVSINDSVHLYMNIDGSAVLKERMRAICWWHGKVSNISLEKSDDTLLVSIGYYDYPQDTVLVRDSTAVVVGHGEFKCGACYADYEINIPAEFVSSKFVSVDRHYRGKLYPIAYVKE